MTVNSKTVNQLRELAKEERIMIPRTITGKADIARHIEMAMRKRSVPRAPPPPSLLKSKIPVKNTEIKK